jgi:hypothetical protein
MKPTLPTTTPLPVFFRSMEMGRDVEVGLAEVDEGGDDGDRVRCQVHQLDAVEVEEPAQEVAITP